MELIGIAAILIAALMVALKVRWKRKARMDRRLKQCGGDVSPEALAQWAENLRAPEPVTVKEKERKAA